MKTVTFDEGPWVLAENDGSSVLVRAKDGKPIAKVWLKDSDFGDYNAQLIVMSHEMLEMLERLTIAPAYEVCGIISLAQEIVAKARSISPIPESKLPAHNKRIETEHGC